MIPSRITNRCLLLFVALSLTACQSFNHFYPYNTFNDTAEPSLTTASDHPAHVFRVSNYQDVVGELATVNTQEGDTLSDVARHYGLGYTDISIANPDISPWTPKIGSRVLLPLQFILPEAPHKGIVLNLATMRMFYYPRRQDTVVTFPVSIGREGWGTPIGLSRISSKTVNPEWHVPASIHREHALKGDVLPNVVRSGPYNPLGYYAMRLANPRYLIHGTNKPYGIGMRVSHGCIQMYPEDIEVLFRSVSVGTPVHIVHQPYLAGWHRDMLYIEIHDPVAGTGNKKWKKTQFLKQLHKMARRNRALIDWDKVDQVIAKADGIPTPILLDSPSVLQLAEKAPQLVHPAHLYGQPTVSPLKDSDWSILVESYQDETMAQRMAAMLTHQGPSIPARVVGQNGVYQVIAGPFKDQQEANATAKRINYEFEIKVQPLEPSTLAAVGYDNSPRPLTEPIRYKKSQRLSKKQVRRLRMLREAMNDAMIRF